MTKIKELGKTDKTKKINLCFNRGDPEMGNKEKCGVDIFKEFWEWFPTTKERTESSE